MCRLALFVFPLLLLGGARAQRPEFSTLSDWKNHNDRWVEWQGGAYMLDSPRDQQMKPLATAEASVRCRRGGREFSDSDWGRTGIDRTGAVVQAVGR